MVRREFIQAVVSLLAAPRLLFSQQPAKASLPPPAPVPWTLGLNPLTPQPHTQVADGTADPDPRFFSAVQMSTLIRLSDLLQPALDNRPGAVAAETPQFLDFLIGASPASRQKVYTGGLTWLDSESQKKYRKPFANLEDAEADALIRPWLRTWMSDHPPSELHANFVSIAHEDIRTATENSKAWEESLSDTTQRSRGALYWFPIEPDLHSVSAAASRIPAHVLAAPKSTHFVPSYPR
jgi:hypothetical protein